MPPINLQNTNAINDFVAITQRSNIDNASGRRTLVGFGNSIMAEKMGVLRALALSSSKSLIQHKNAGVGSDTSQLMLNRLDDVPEGNHVVPCLEGTNDASAGLTGAAYGANTKGYILELIKKGCTVEMLMTPPKDVDAHKTLIREYNIWLFCICEELGIDLYDCFTQFSTTLGRWVSGASSDATHPNIEPAYSAGVLLAQMRRDKDFALPLPRDNDNGGLITNPLMLDFNAATNLPDGGFYADLDDCDLVISETALGSGMTLAATSKASAPNATVAIHSTVFPMTIGKRYRMFVRFSGDFTQEFGDSAKFEIYSIGRTSYPPKVYALQNCNKTNMPDQTIELDWIGDDTTARISFELRQYKAGNWSGTLRIAQLIVFCVDDYLPASGTPIDINGNTVYLP